jgi:hypothetical protein
MFVLWLTDLVFILASRHLFSHVGEVICPSGLLCSNFVMGDFQCQRETGDDGAAFGAGF